MWSICSDKHKKSQGQEENKATNDKSHGERFQQRKTPLKCIYKVHEKRSGTRRECGVVFLFWSFSLGGWGGSIAIRMEAPDKE